VERRLSAEILKGASPKQLYLIDPWIVQSDALHQDSWYGNEKRVGGEREIRICDLGEMMMKLCGFEGEIVLHPSPSGSVKRRAPKLDRLRELIGYEETVRLEEGLKRTAKAYRVIADVIEQSDLSFTIEIAACAPSRSITQ
jgi:hypothetical protein